MAKKSKFNDLYKHIFGEDYVEEKYKYIQHSFTRKVVGKNYCVKCGLISLRNPFTLWAIQMGCMHEAHTNYKQKRKKVKTI